MDATEFAVSETASPNVSINAGISRPARIVFGLRLKILAIVIGISLLSGAGTTYFLYSIQRQHLIENTRKATLTLSNSLEASMQHAMMTGDWDMVKEIITAVADEPSIEKIRILNSRGIVGVSSDQREKGARFDQAGRSCQFCHLAGQRPRNQTVVSELIPNQPLLLNVNLLENQPACHACHDPEQPILGLLMIEAPLTSVNDQLHASLMSTIFMTVIGTGVLIGLMLLALRRFIIQPVDELGKGMAEISAGNLDHPVHVNSQDEFGQLSHSFNEMRQRLKASLTDLERRNKELAVLNEVALTVNQSLDLQHVLSQAVESVSTKLDIESGLLFLYNERTDRFELCAARGTPEFICQEIERRRRDRSWDISGQVAESNQPYYVADMSQDKHFEGLWDALNRRSYVNVPLRCKNKVVGTLALVSYAGKPFPKEILNVVEAVGNEIGMAIENARLYRQLRYMASLEERERLAREMHDHIAQALGYLNVKALITEDLLTAGQIPAAHESLEELRKVAKIAYTDVREAIFNLRSAAAAHTDLLPTLKEYLEEYHAYYGLHARLEVHREDLCIFSSEVASQVMRIIQEALTNVRKHASARSVWIDIKPDGDQICISIKDDGCGFSPAQVALSARQHFGLQIMQERAASIGGEVEIVSRPGSGTQVLIRVPASQDSRMVI